MPHLKKKTLNDETIDWYNQNAENYFNETNSFSMKEKYPQFLKYIPKNGEILDAGCGSGRDAKFFLSMGYKVSAFDASTELSKLASENTSLDVITATFAEFTSNKKFDGIWANASLLHVPKKSFENSFLNLINHLKDNGVLFASMKLGDTEEKDSNGRFFNYVSMNELKSIFSKYKNFKLIEMKQTKNNFRIGDRPFINFVIRKESSLT